MTTKKAIEVLRRFNAWRRYDGPLGEGPSMPDPKEVGVAIDVACVTLAALLEKDKSHD